MREKLLARPVDIGLPAGFSAELLYEVPRERGSWIALALDGAGRLIASAQEGGLYRVTVGAPGSADADLLVEDLGIDLGEVQGLAWAGGSLWAMAGGAAAETGGLHRLTDADGDGRFEEVRHVLGLEGSGEHGPHAIVPAPDGRTLYLIAGNHTDLPEISASRVPPFWDEDELGERIEDPNGHAVGIRAPGGWVLAVDHDGRRRELFACGLRNAYDLAFDARGELFTFDSDMEWDLGLPWYRPPRFLHVVSGADFGWRSGTGYWPERYPDSLPDLASTALASPTGLVFGTEARFPGRYRRALFAADWAYGTIYALHLAENGAGFSAEVETFAKGEPLPVTDLVVGADGALYFATGGRGLASALYRVSWDGAIEPDEEGAADLLAARARALRARLERWHGAGAADPVLAWPALDAPDPVLRHAGRVALEHRDAAAWEALALAEARPRAALAGLLALARVGAPNASTAVARRVLELGVLDEAGELRYEALRVLELVLLRMDPLDAEVQAELVARVEALHPTHDAPADRELLRLLVALRSPSAVAELLPQLESTSPLEPIHAALLAREVTWGWDDAARLRLLDFLDRAVAEIAGGASARLYLERIRDDLVARFDAPTRQRLADRLAPAEEDTAEPEPAARRFVRSWTTADLAGQLERVSSGRSFERGAEVWLGASCASCHRIAESGGSTGPDLTGAAGRFSPAELLRTILEPHAEVSDQYRETEVRTLAGELILGRLIEEDGVRLLLRPPPPREDVVEVAVEEILERRPHPLSSMPEGLLDVYAEDEVLDLLAFVLAGGSPDHPAFGAGAGE